MKLEREKIGELCRESKLKADLVLKKNSN